MRYAFGVALLAFVLLLVSSSAVDVAARPAPHKQLELTPLQTESHDLAVNYISLVGPAAVNLSDTNGRYMWVLSELRNLSTHPDLAQISIAFNGAMPNGCQRTESLLLPGQTAMVMSPNEQKTMIWRVRYQCHGPAVLQTIRQTVTVAVTHCDPATTADPGPVTQPTPGGPCGKNNQVGGSEVNLANNAATASKQILVQ